MPSLIGLDVGTSAVKALLVSEGGAVLATATSAYPLSTPHPQWSEQNPDDWWRATGIAVRELLEQAGGADIAAVGLTGQMHGLVLLDRCGAVLRPAILWNDQRTARECERIHEIVGFERTIEITGKPALTGFTSPKVLWVREHEPEVFAAAAALLLPKDYVRFRLTGKQASDVADASGTGLFDFARRAWSDEMIDALDVPRQWLPEVTESPVPSSAVSAEGAAATGLPAGTPVIAGAGDQAAEAIGCGIVRPGGVSVTIGTSGVVFAATDAPAFDHAGRLHAYCHAIPERWHFMGVMLSAGGSLRWYRDTIGAGTYPQILELAAQAPPGCEGLTFLPYLTGERTPHPDPDARGAFVGLTLRSDRAALARAVIEGISFGLRDALELVRARGLPLERVRVSGGGARSAIWRQILADVFGCPVTTVTAVEGAAFGAALLAGVGAGVWESAEKAADSVVLEREESVPSGVDYREPYARYRSAYPALAPTWAVSQ